MFDKFFTKYPEYTIIEKPTDDIVNRYKGKLPDTIIQFWKEYGFGIYMNGFIKFINPFDYQYDLDEAYDNIDNEIVFAITAFGDFLTWDNEGKWINIIFFRYGNVDALSSSFERLFEKGFLDDTFLPTTMKSQNYLPAKERLGDLAFDQCYGYVPLLGIGGEETPANLEKVKIKEHIFIITQMMRRIED